jgi:hypothetical protein
MEAVAATDAITVPRWLPFSDARDYARRLGLTTQRGWRFCRPRPFNIPSNPERTYSGEWVDWYDWFGTKRPECPRDRQRKSMEVAAAMRRNMVGEQEARSLGKCQGSQCCGCQRLHSSSARRGKAMGPNAAKKVSETRTLARRRSPGCERTMRLWRMPIPLKCGTIAHPVRKTVLEAKGAVDTLNPACKNMASAAGSTVVAPVPPNNRSRKRNKKRKRGHHGASSVDSKASADRRGASSRGAGAAGAAAGADALAAAEDAQPAALAARGRRRRAMSDML